MNVETRCAELKRRIEAEHGESQMLYCAVICNGCGRRVTALTPEKLAQRLPGWRLGGYGEDADYCSGCLG